jgi:hypothetical protein
MPDYLYYFGVGLTILFVVEVGIWQKICLGLSMKYERADFTKIMIHAPYRIKWLPKVLVFIVELIVFCISARYYRNGGQELTLAISLFVLLALFVGLVSFEGVRAVRSYEQKMEFEF